jgi:hypothetical protein
MTRQEFLENPSAYFYKGESIPDEWLVEAWESVPTFRENVLYGIERYISKGFDLQPDEIAGLARVLPLPRMVELYQRLRDNLPLSEPAFRPAFEQVFGDRIAAFPTPLTEGELEQLWTQCVDESAKE